MGTANIGVVSTEKKLSKLTGINKLYKLNTKVRAKIIGSNTLETVIHPSMPKLIPVYKPHLQPLAQKRNVKTPQPYLLAMSPSLHVWTEWIGFCTHSKWGRWKLRSSWSLVCWTNLTACLIMLIVLANCRLSWINLWPRISKFSSQAIEKKLKKYWGFLADHGNHLPSRSPPPLVGWGGHWVTWPWRTTLLNVK